MVRAHLNLFDRVWKHPINGADSNPDCCQLEEALEVGHGGLPVAVSS